jgi:macrodomain Ter protein organizer (MatP/YcbG family)
MNLERAELAINEFNLKQTFEINDIIELYNIKLFFDNDIYLLIWTNEYKTCLFNTVKKFELVIRSFILTINNDNIISIFNELEFYYTTSFWKLIEKFSVYQSINSLTFLELSKCKRYFLREVLQQKNLVSHYSKEIQQYIIDKKKSSEIIITFFEEEHSRNQPELYFPFKIGDKIVETLINNYLDSEDINLNYVRLIIKSRTLKLSDKTKLKAKKISKELEQKLFNKGNAVKQAMTLVISETQEEPLKITTESETTTYSYGKKWLDSAKEPFQILQNFAGLFSYISNQGCINLVSKQHEITGFETVFTKSKNEYFNSFSFQHKSFLAQAQIHLYIRYLEINHIRIEEVLESVVNDFINSNFQINDLRINLPTEMSTILEKNRMISPELEFLLKQYKCFVEEGLIDFELLEFSSTPLYLSEVKSRLTRKYGYAVGQNLNAIIFHLYSKNAFLHYIEPFMNKYDCFVDLIINESIKLEDIADHNRNIIDFLIQENCVFLDENNFIKIKNFYLVFIAKTIYNEDVISYYHQNGQVRAEIDALESKNYLKFENSLFTDAERKYINYHLNKKEFTNSHDLRNKYSHGSNSTSEDEQGKDYGILLKMLVLVICKIIDDLILIERETGANTRYKQFGDLA